MNDIDKLQERADRIDELQLRVRYGIEGEGPFIGRPCIHIHNLGDDEGLSRRDVEAAIIAAYKSYMDPEREPRVPWSALQIVFHSQDLSDSFQRCLASMLSSSDDTEEIVMLETYFPNIVIETNGRTPLGPLLLDVLHLYPGDVHFVVTQYMPMIGQAFDPRSIMTYMRPKSEVNFKFVYDCGAFDAHQMAIGFQQLDELLAKYRTHQFLRPREAREPERYVWLIGSTPGGRPGSKACDVLQRFALSRGYNFTVGFSSPFSPR